MTPSELPAQLSFSDSESEEEAAWMPFRRSEPDLMHTRAWQSDGFVSPFQPSPLTLVPALAQAAKIERSDTVYDLGCGDGRILLELHRLTGCSGVGFDLDERLVARGKKYRERFGANSPIILQTQNFLDETTDLTRATVVYMYLLPDALAAVSNILIRLLRDSRSRLRAVVSHFWPIPGRSACKEVEEQKLYIYFEEPKN